MLLSYYWVVPHAHTNKRTQSTILATNQPHVVGLVWKGSEGRTVLERASKSPFFVQPVFREDGYFMLLSQFQAPAHFLLAYLEDYKMDPHSATPLLTCSIFDDYAVADAQIDLALVRCDVVNRSIRDDEGRKIIDALLRNYRDDYADVQTFNERPEHFMIDDFISRMEQRWNDDDSDESKNVGGGDKASTTTTTTTTGEAEK